MRTRFCHRKCNNSNKTCKCAGVEEEPLHSNAQQCAASSYSTNKIYNMVKLLDAGIDIEAIRKYKNNTALPDGETIDIAVNQKITDILNSKGAVSKKLQKKVNAKSNNENNGLVFQKRAGTSGACGQLYESKLLCLLFHRAKYANGISEFYLGTNINGIGALDDICLKYKIPGRPPVMLFLQAKHREDPEKGKVTVNDLLSADGDLSLAKYIDSYLRIKKAICPSSTDLVFKEDFEHVDCNFVIFTSAKDDFDNKRKKQVNLSLMNEKVHDFIFTKNIDGVFQFDYTETDVDYLVQIIIKEQIKQLGKNFMKEIMAGQIENSTSFESMMKDELIKKYHVILATSVLAVTEETETKTVLKRPKVPVSETNTGIRPPKEAVLETNTLLKGVFRQDFFETHDDLLCVLKDTFYSEIVLTHNKINMNLTNVEEIDNNLNQLIDNPSAFTVSNVIGNVVIFDEKTYKLKLLENNLYNILSNDKIQHYRSELQKLKVTSAVVKEAIEIAGLRKMMGLRNIPLPDSFGNKDMTVKEKRIAFLETEITSLMKESVANNKIIELNNETDSRILPINGGIGGAVGNLLVFDEDSEMLKFSEKTLPNYADKLRTKLKDKLTENDSLSYYRFNVNINDFPRFSFRGTEYDKSVARNFLDRLYFYTGQGKENDIEHIIKLEIDKHYNADKTEDEYLFRIHTDAIFSKFHDDMQKWWMEQKEATYLTDKCEIFEKAKNEVVQQPVLTIINLMYINRVKKMGVEFNENAVSYMELQTFTKGMLNIITDANILSGIKVWQYLKSCKDYTFLDFDYVAGLPSSNYKRMMVELKNTDLDTLIILYETFKDTESCDRVKDIINNFKGNKIIIITDEYLSTELKVYFPEESILDIRDDSNMSNITEESQIHILKDTRIVYQGEEVPLGTVIDNCTIHFLNGNILNKLLNNEKVEIGMAIADMKYKEVKNQYVDRYLRHDDKTYQVNTLKDIDENVVVVTALPGEGKSTLLTHISIETKKIDPKLWIARINLKDHSNEFFDWNQEITDINIIKTVKFICKASIKNIGNLDLELVAIDGKITLNNRELIDSTILLQLDLFIHFFNNANIIYLFYGFDEICSQYKKEVILLLENLENCNQRFWVTTCSYTQYEKSLERYFKNVYTLVPRTTGSEKKHLHRYLKTNGLLSKLNYDQLNNLSDCLDDTMSRAFGPERESLAPDQKRDLVLKIGEMLSSTFILSTQCIGDIRSDFIEDLIKKRSNEYKGEIPNLFPFPILRTLTLCKRFLESNLKQLYTVKTDDSLDEKHFIINDNEELRIFLQLQHKLKNLALCEFFTDSVLESFMCHDEVKEIEETVKQLETSEKSGVASYMLNSSLPFAHPTCVEYYITEYLIDLLQSLSTGSLANPKTHRALWDIIVNILLCYCSPSVRDSFDYKLSADPDLAQSTNTDESRNIIFELIKKQNQEINKEANSSRGQCSTQNSSTESAASNGLNNITELFSKSLELNKDNKNVDILVDVLKTGASLVLNVKEKINDEVLLAIKSGTKAEVCEILSSENVSELPAKCHAMFIESGKVVNEICDEIPLFKKMYELGNAGMSFLSGLAKAVIDDPTPKPSTSANID